MSLFYSFREDEKFYYYRSKNRLQQLIVGLVFFFFYAIIVVFAKANLIDKDYLFMLFTVVFTILVIISVVGCGTDGIRFWFRRTTAFFKNKKMYAERIDFLNAEWKIEK